MKRIILSSLIAAATAVLMTACSSNVKLDEAPVENRTGTAVKPEANTNDVTSKAVTPVDIAANNNNTAGPQGVAKIIYFDYDSFTIKPEFQGAVEAHAKFMAANKVRKLAVEGHTDERGGREYNLALGQKRAEAVRRALGLLGVTDAQVEAVSFGKEKPADSGTNEAALAKNRRAELTYR